MKAFVMTAVKEPFTEKEVPDPEPGPGQVRVRLSASGVCGTDVHVWRGELPLPLPIVPGHEPAGVVDLTGPGVTAVKVGDRVGVSWFQAGCGRCTYCQKKRARHCAEPRTWISNGGSYADYMIADAEGCTLLPDALPWEVAAPLFCGGFAAMSAYRSARPQTGERIAVVGVGGLGHIAIQIAKALGHEVIAITNSSGKVDDAKALGADEVIVIKNHAGQELSGMGGADIILSFSPEMKQNSQALMGLRPDGRFVTTAPGAEPIQVDPTSTLFKQISVIGSAHNDRADLVDVLKLAAEGQVKPILETYPIEKLNYVLTRLAEGKVRHRAVVMHAASVG
jgi:alcohol dehydrogenase